MDDVRVGRLLRALRRRRGLRQLDVAMAAGIGQTTVSLVERGHLGRLSIATLRATFASVDARFDANVTWRGGAIDRLLDERHAQLVGAVADLLRRRGWLVDVEATFAVYAERGSIDVLAFHESTGTMLVVEAKTELTSIEETLRRLDVKTRLAADIAEHRFGSRVVSRGRLLAVLDTATSRRRVDRHRATLSVALPARGRLVRAWLREPRGAMRGLLFLSASNPRAPRRGARRDGRANNIMQQPPC